MHLLKKNDLPGEIEIHTDLLSTLPSALSRKRALKAGREHQAIMPDPGTATCILCRPELKSVSSYPHEELIPDRVGHFENDFPYLSGDQRVIYLWHSELAKRTDGLHRVKLEDFGKSELYWLTKACVVLGKKYQAPDRTHDLMRMIVGFNLGRLAGQSIPHFHVQYGWEIVLDRRTITEKELGLYFEELSHSELVLYENDRIKVVAPWTPKGQFALELYFNRKYEIVELDDWDLATLAIYGHRIVQKYLSLGIQNLNIVFANSPKGRKTEPLVIHFVPRVNMTALYEIKGVNVVDTPPQKIAEEFRRHGGDEEPINWIDLYNQVQNFDADATFDADLNRMLQKANKSGT